MTSLVQLVCDLADLFDRLQLPFALGGALATNYWGVVRTTQDIDCLVAVPALKYQTLAEALQTIGCRSRDDAGNLTEVTAVRLREEANDKKFMECFRDSVRIEMFIPAVPLQHEILRRAVMLPLGNREVPITTAEDMILLKMAFHRVKDLQDVRGILWIQRGQLDMNYLRNWSSRTHTEEVQRELEQFLQEYAASGPDDSATAVQ